MIIPVKDSNAISSLNVLEENSVEMIRAELDLGMGQGSVTTIYVRNVAMRC
jgi:hypothetical protein